MPAQGKKKQKQKNTPPCVHEWGAHSPGPVSTSSFSWEKSASNLVRNKRNENEERTLYCLICWIQEKSIKKNDDVFGI